jgi:hypothetical protein
MADTKITALAAITTVDPAADVLPIVDISDTSMAASGTTKKITSNQILGAGGTATLASATITGALTAGGNVGFGTTNLTSVAGYNSLKINNATNGAIIDLAQGDAYKGRLVATASDFAFQTAGTIPIIMQVGGNNSYRIDTSGLFTWYDGAGGTRMTLNSTGLGLGVSPITALSFPIGTTKVVAQSATTAHAAGNVGTLKFGISDGGGDYSGLHVVNSHNGTYSSQDLLFFTGEGGVSTCTERMRITRSGNVGVGVTPSAWKANHKAIQFGPFSTGYSSIYTDDAANTWFNSLNFQSATTRQYVATGNAAAYRLTVNGQHQWYTDSVGGVAGGTVSFTQAMTLDASGNLLVGTTNSASNAGIGLKASYSATAPYFATVGSSNASNVYSYLLYSTTDAAFKFYVSYSGTVSATNGTISAISDARLKENVQDIDVGLGAILALKPRKFDWKTGRGKDIKGDRGFIAQEFETVFPNLVDEWKDAAPEGEAPYKSVRQDLIPVLVKAIQELAAEVNALKNA